MIWLVLETLCIHVANVELTLMPVRARLSQSKEMLYVIWYNFMLASAVHSSKAAASSGRNLT